MLQHISGYIYVDDRHIILYTGPAPTNSRRLLHSCEQAFPELFTFHFGRKLPQPRLDTCFKMIPSWFDRAIRVADEENDWDKFPFVALDCQGGSIGLKPFAMHK